MGRFSKLFTVRDVQVAIVPRGVDFGLTLTQIATSLGIERRELDVLLTAVEGRDMTLRDHLAEFDLHGTPPSE